MMAAHDDRNAHQSYGQGRGISYGSLYNYDTAVPLCLYGPRFRCSVFESPVEAVDLAPTLARVCGVVPPSSSTGRVLAEALAESTALGNLLRPSGAFTDTEAKQHPVSRA